MKKPPLSAHGLLVLEVFSKVHSHTFPAISYIFCTEKLLSAPVVNNILEYDSFLNGFGHAVNVLP